MLESNMNSRVPVYAYLIAIVVPNFKIAYILCIQHITCSLLIIQPCVVHDILDFLL